MDRMLEQREHILLLPSRSLLTGRTCTLDRVSAVSRSRGRAATDLAAGILLGTSLCELRAVVDEDRRLLRVAIDTRFLRLGMTRSRLAQRRTGSATSSSSSARAPYPAHQERATVALRARCNSVSQEARRGLPRFVTLDAALALTAAAALSSVAAAAQAPAIPSSRSCNTQHQMHSYHFIS